MEITKEEVDIMLDDLKAKLHSDLREVKVDVHQLTNKLSKMEVHIETTLKGHETQRLNFNKSIILKIDELQNWFNEHNNNEMIKYEEIITSIKNLTTTMENVIFETKENSNYISKKAHDDYIDDEVTKRLNKINKPKEAMWNKIKVNVVVALTLGALGALGAGVTFIYDLYKKLGG